MKRKMLLISLVLLLAISLVAMGCPAPAPPVSAPPVAPAPTPTPARAPAWNMIQVTTNPASGLYPWAVGLGETINRYVEQCTCKTSALGGGFITLPKVGSGEADFASMIAVVDAVDAYNGKGRYSELKAMKNLRALCLREVGLVQWYVTKASGVKDIMELKGKKVNAGLPGSFALGVTDWVEAGLNIGVDWQQGSTTKAKADLKDRRIIGYIKSSPAIPPGPPFTGIFDASALDVTSLVPLTIIGFTDEQKAKIDAAHPGIFWNKTPAGGIKEAPDVPEHWVITTGYSGAFISEAVPLDVQYRVIKAIDEHWQDTVAAAYPPCGKWDPIKDTIDLTKGIPLCAGLVKYAKEKGIEVPEDLIPREWKMVQ